MCEAEKTLAETPNFRHLPPMKAVKPQPAKCKESQATTPALFAHIKPLPQSLSLEDSRLQFQRNNRLASSRSLR